MQKLLIMFFTVTMFLTFQSAAIAEKALLQTTINALPQNNPHSTRMHVQPGTLMQLQATIKNIGTAPSKIGKSFIQFAFPAPLHKQENSVIFTTEIIDLPVIAPKEQITLLFKKTHQWPTLFDFIRNDWAMREYQMIAEMVPQSQIIGTMAVAFSAYYYEGTTLNKPVEVPSNTNSGEKFHQ